mgnify:CR=1 FL=1
MEAYNDGHRIFGENKVQELVQKHEVLPKNIRWHMIGHLQSNKVKYIAPFVHLIHGVDSVKILKEINKQGLKNNKKINCLLQIHIAKEQNKFGFDIDEINDSLQVKFTEDEVIEAVRAVKNEDWFINRIRKELNTIWNRKNGVF